MEDLLFGIKILGFIVEFIGLGVIVYAVFISLKEMIKKRYNLDHIRRHFGKMLLTGLEFIIAADLILAAVVRDTNDLIQLTGIVIIRAILEHAVQKEVEIKD